MEITHKITKLMARRGACSRRQAETWIKEGRVGVDGHPITNPALRFEEYVEITIDEKILPKPEPTRLWCFHKPRGVITSRVDPEGRKTIMDFIPNNLGHIMAVGRLDYNSEGLLLFTNDGQLSRHMELPSAKWEREYRVRAFGKVSQERLDALKNGIKVDGIQYGSMRVKKDKAGGINAWYHVVLCEGKNREIRNVFKALGLDVSRLIRIRYGPFMLEKLPPGQMKEVSKAHIPDIG